MSSMKRSVHDYAMALYEAVATAPDQSRTISERFLRQLSLDHNQRLLRLILAELDRIDVGLTGGVIARVDTAESLSEAQSERLIASIQQQTGAKMVRLQTNVLPARIGGIAVQIDDLLIDHTIKRKIDALAARL